MRFSTEWIDQGPNASAEERATLCRLSLHVSEENACRFFDPVSNRTCHHVTVPAVHLAEGLATDWWSISAVVEIESTQSGSIGAGSFFLM